MQVGIKNCQTLATGLDLYELVIPKTKRHAVLMGKGQKRGERINWKIKLITSSRFERERKREKNAGTPPHLAPKHRKRLQP